MDDNRYAPPKAPVGDIPSSDGKPTTASWPLYSPMQMAVGTFLGTAMAGAWLAAANFKATGQSVKARKTLWWGAAVAALTMVVAFILPEKFPNSVLPLAVAFGVRGLAETHFGVIVGKHQKDGGAVRSWWRVVGISLLIAAIVLVVVFAVVLPYELVTADISP